MFEFYGAKNMTQYLKLKMDVLEVAVDIHRAR